MITKLIYSAAFYAGWIFCINEAAKGNYIIGPSVIALAILLHLYLSEDGWHEMLFIAAISALGTLIDSLYMVSGVLTYEGLYPGLRWLAPLWVTSMYALYAAVFSHCFGWLRNRMLLATLFGGIGGSLSYWGSITMGVGHYLVPLWLGSLIIGIVWAMFFPFSFFLFDWLKPNIK